MKGFRRQLEELPSAVQEQAQRAYGLWRSDHHHPSLQFKRASQRPILPVHCRFIRCHGWFVVASFPRKNVTPADSKPGRESSFRSIRDDFHRLKSSLDSRFHENYAGMAVPKNTHSVLIHSIVEDKTLLKSSLDSRFHGNDVGIAALTNTDSGLKRLK